MLYFRFPFEENIKTILPGSGNSKVEFFPFQEGETISFKGKIVNADLNFEDYSTENLAENFLTENAESKEKYLQRINSAISVIKENNLAKLVIARKLIIDISEKTISIKSTFQNLCEDYPNAFCYFFVENNICWIGAFSEILGKFDKKNNHFETMSLAGTLPKNEAWTDKEIEEQKPVTKFISNILQKYSDEIFQSETYDHFSGEIKHLRTDFSAKIKGEDLDELISQLHPTPAVCGIPTDFCREKISEIEPFSRKLYAGYIRIENENSVQCFVNLRCAEFYKNQVEIYAGGGITAQSNPEKEWRETELKSHAISQNIAFLNG